MENNLLIYVFFLLPTEHAWQVQIQRKGIAEDKGLIGRYHLCLTEKSLKLVRYGSALTTNCEHRLQNVEFMLTTIRRLVVVYKNFPLSKHF